MNRSTTLRLFALAAAAVVVLTLPASAFGVLSGRNGRIVFISGREGPDNNDTQARPYFWRIPPDALSPSVSPPLATATGQHRHPTWSPDRTKIAYAHGDNATANYDIYVLDLTTPGATPQNITQSNGVTDDRPAWSPDGTRIAYESGSATGSDIFVSTVDGSSVGNLTITPGTPESKPAWSPDSQTLYYSSGNLAATPNGNNNDVKIFQEPADGSGSGTELIHISGAHAFQPSISPDGTRICFTFSTTAGLNSSAVVFVGPLSSPSSSGPLTASGQGDYNCTWSPNGFRIAYVSGTFNSGALVAEDSDGSDAVPQELTNDPMNFDGNPDWAPDAAPTCEDGTATTFVDTGVSIPLPCTDNGPQYERTPVNRSIVDQPANGTVNQPAIGETSVTYTPNPGFTGTDTFTYRSRDDFGFAPTLNTVTVNVVRRPVNVVPLPTCLGRPATIIGTNAIETLTGTAGGDVIVSLGGSDTVRSGRGADLVCTGDGNDRVLAGSGNDRVLGGSGNDRVRAGTGNDRVRGESGNDRLYGQRGRDRLFGGSGRDRLFGGSAADRLFGQSGRDTLRGGPGLDRLSGGAGRDSARQ
jgi:Ca2+-binding RTX toxin-like protein